MQVQVRHQPSFAVARCLLAAGEPLRVESGAMLATSWGVQVEAQHAGRPVPGAAAGRARRRVAVRHDVHGAGGWRLGRRRRQPARRHRHRVGHPGPCLLRHRGCWIANAHGVEIQTRWGGSQNLFGGEGGFVLQATGQGEVVLGSYGAVDTVELGPGDAITIDSGHVVAYDAGVSPGCGARSRAARSSR